MSALPTNPQFQIVRLPEKAVEQMREVKELEKEWKDETPESDPENVDEDLEYDSSTTNTRNRWRLKVGI